MAKEYEEKELIDRTAEKPADGTEKVFKDMDLELLTSVIADSDSKNNIANSDENSDEDSVSILSDTDEVTVFDGKNRTEIKEQNYGKFKNPQELLKAYGELEKEFTRRSQRLAQLENTEAEREVSESESEEKWKAEADKFFDKTPSARPFAKEIANELLSDPDLRRESDCLFKALTKVLVEKFRTPEQLMSDGQFLNRYVLSSEDVKKAVIEDYLDGIRRGAPPRTLTDKGLQCAAPKSSPRSIKDAGEMFLKSNK